LTLQSLHLLRVVIANIRASIGDSYK
jgi:hypothetical protein